VIAVTKAWRCLGLASRNLARSDVPDRVKLIEKNVDLYLEEGARIVRLRRCAQLSTVNGARARIVVSSGKRSLTAAQNDVSRSKEDAPTPCFGAPRRGKITSHDSR
jgi:hypothetical protein